MKYLLVLLWACLALPAGAQVRQLAELKALILKSEKSTHDSLVRSGWTVRPEQSAVKDNQSYETFSFGNHKKESHKALEWLRIHADDGLTNQVYYQPAGPLQYQHLLDEIKATSKVKNDVQVIEDNQLSTYYVSEDFAFKTIVGKGSHTIMVMGLK